MYGTLIFGSFLVAKLDYHNDGFLKELPVPSYTSGEVKTSRGLARLINHLSIYRQDLFRWAYCKIFSSNSKVRSAKNNLFPFESNNLKLKAHGQIFYGTSQSKSILELKVLLPCFSFYQLESNRVYDVPVVDSVTVSYREINGASDEEIYKLLIDEINSAGSWVAVLTPGDSLAPWIGFELSNVKNNVCYFDSTRVDSGAHKSAQFKSDFSKVNLWARNEIGDIILIQPEAVSLFPEMVSPSFAYQFWLNCGEQGVAVDHVSLLGYHHSSEESSDTEYAVVATHLKKQQRGMKVGTGSLSFESKNESVSIIIPTRDALEVLKPCLESIENRCAYEFYEIIIVDNGSSEPECLSYLNQIGNKENVSVIRDDREFNFAALMNIGASKAKGRHLLFLNNDTELISPMGIEEMVGWSRQQDIGAVGCQLLFSNGNIQHAGAVIGINQEVHHAFFNAKRNNVASNGKLNKIAEFSSITAAAMMIEKKKFEVLNGFDTTYAVNYNDIDLCLRLREDGLSNVYLPNVKFYHNEYI